MNFKDMKQKTYKETEQLVLKFLILMTLDIHLT